jgi:hypothetical protein
MPMELPLRVFHPMVIAFVLRPSTFVSGFLPYTDFATGIPVLGAGDRAADLLPEMSRFASCRREFKRGYVQSWNFSIGETPAGPIQPRLRRQPLRYEMNGRDINAAPLGAGSAGQPLARYGRFMRSVLRGYLDSKYHSLQVSVNRRTARTLPAGSYTWSRTMALRRQHLRKRTR